MHAIKAYGGVVKKSTHSKSLYDVQQVARFIVQPFASRGNSNMEWEEGWMGSRSGLECIEKRKKKFVLPGNRTKIPRTFRASPNDYKDWAIWFHDSYVLALRLGIILSNSF